MNITANMKTSMMSAKRLGSVRPSTLKYGLFSGVDDIRVFRKKSARGTENLLYQNQRSRKAIYCQLSWIKVSLNFAPKSLDSMTLRKEKTATTDTLIQYRPSHWLPPSLKDNLSQGLKTQIAKLTTT